MRENGNNAGVSSKEKNKGADNFTGKLTDASKIITDPKHDCLQQTLRGSAISLGQPFLDELKRVGVHLKIYDSRFLLSFLVLTVLICFVMIKYSSKDWMPVISTSTALATLLILSKCKVSFTKNKKVAW